MLRAVDHFRHRERSQDVKERERRKWFIAAKDQKERKEKLEEQAESAVLDMVAAVEIASATEVQAFQTKLDHYDEAVVKALMENQETLDAIYLHLETLRDNAHKLDDGRLVFKDENGNVFDYDGNKLTPDDVDPDSIPDSATRWEPYRDARDEQMRLEAEREQILEYQQKADHARERSNADDFTKSELEEFELELADDLPPSVAKHLPDDLKPSTPSLASDDTSVTSPSLTTKMELGRQTASTLVLGN